MHVYSSFSLKSSLKLKLLFVFIHQRFQEKEREKKTTKSATHQFEMNGRCCRMAVGKTKTSLDIILFK